MRVKNLIKLCTFFKFTNKSKCVKIIVNKEKKAASARVRGECGGEHGEKRNGYPQREGIYQTDGL